MTTSPTHQPDAFEAGLLAAIPRLKVYAGNLTRSRDRAQDLLQDTLERALRFRQQFEMGTNLEAWLTTIMRNHHFEHHRKASTRYEFTGDIFDWSVEKNLTINDDPSIKMEAAEVINAVSQLSPLHQGIVLSIADGAKQEDLAVELNIAYGTVRSRLNRARHKLREYA